MNSILDDFLGADPILGEKAKNDLIKQGEVCLDLVIERFESLERMSILQIRLSELFGNFGATGLQKLMEVLEEGEWRKMINSTYCFKHLPQRLASSRLITLIFKTNNIDIKRCAIDALGYVGSRSDISLLFNIIKEDSFFKNEKGYYWEKLSHNIFTALLRSATIEESNKISTDYELPNIKLFYEIADKDYENLLSRSAYNILPIFVNFKPTATDSIIRQWLNNEHIAIQELALKALYPMRLVRVVNILKKYADSHSDNEKIRSLVALVLSDIPSKEAANTVKEIYLQTSGSSKYYESICLYLAICLDKIEDHRFIKDTYSSLINMGGEIAAHTYYNLGLLGYDKSIWSTAINSDDFIIRASVAPLYALMKDEESIQRLLQMEREAAYDIERLIILSSLIQAGLHEKITDLHNTLINLPSTLNLQLFRYTWKREIILALRTTESKEKLFIWEKIISIDAEVSYNELSKYKISKENKKNLTPLTSKAMKPESSMKNIFISYSHKDVKWKTKLENNLSSLRNQALISDWNDTQLEAGDWDKQIEQEMERADIFLLLITQNFISSSYIRSKELTKAYSKYKEGKAKIFPVICDSCLWELQPITEAEKALHPVENREMYIWLGKFQPFPKYGKPIKNWTNQQDAFLDVVNQLRKHL